MLDDGVQTAVWKRVDYEVEVLDQWFLSFLSSDPKSGLNQKLTTQALKVWKIKRFSKHFSNN